MTTPTRVTSAPALDVTSRPSTNALRAPPVRARGRPLLDVAGDGERSTDGVLGRVGGVAGGRRHSPVGHGRGEDRVEDAAEHGHAEGAADLTGGVVDGRAHAGLLPRQRAHDRLGGRGHGQAHAAGDRITSRRGRAASRRWRRRSERSSDRPMVDQPSRRPRRSLVPNRSTTAARAGRGSSSAIAHGARAARRPASGRVAEHELQVLGEEEERAEQGEERQGDGRLAAVKRGLRKKRQSSIGCCVCSSHQDEGAQSTAARRRTRRARAGSSSPGRAPR